MTGTFQIEIRQFEIRTVTGKFSGFQKMIYLRSRILGTTTDKKIKHVKSIHFI
jgi:hypothetical protein